MRIKVFKAADLKEAMAMVKDELGRDAVILHTKRYKQGGFLGYKSKEVVEVTAAVDDTPRRPRVKLPAMPRTPRQPAARPPEPPKPQKAAPPRNVLSQYKTAGTEEGVSLARVQNQEIELPATPETEGFAPLTPEPILRAPAAPKTSKPAKKRPPQISVQPSQNSEEETFDGLSLEEIESGLAEPILNKPESAVERSAKTPASSRAAQPEGAPRKEKSRIIKAETLAAAAAKETAQTKAEEMTEPETAVASNELSVAPSEVSAEMPETVGDEQEVSDKQKKINALEDELAQMRQMLRQVMNQPASGDETVTLKDALMAQDLRDDVMQDMIRKIPPATMMLGKDSPEAVKALGDYLHSVVKTGDGIGLKDGRPKIVALIGTTGVGKTTTIAKIAAKFVLERGISVALITADTYRISAVDQLRTYSDIIGLPLEIVYSPEELKPALRKHRGKKLILIDTAGRSQNNEYQMDELKELLSVDPSIEKHLVLSATTKECDAEAILERFAACRPDRLLMTKTDETESIGFIVNLLFDRRLAMSYLTTGQSVPDDIEPAKPEALARLMLR